MKITRNASSASMTGSEPDNFTGQARVDNLASTGGEAPIVTAFVTFAPGARTVWHRHPVGQTVIVTAGKGWVQREGGAIEEISPGDTVFFEPNEKHWHGATATTGMTHIAITQSVNGSGVEWMEPVPAEDYAA